MSIAAAIAYQLLNTSAVSAIVSDRIRPLHQEQDLDAPYIVYYLTRAPEHQISGAAVGLSTAELTIECYADSEDAYADVRALADAVRGTLDGLRGNVGSPAVAVRTCVMTSDADSAQPPIDGNGRGTFIVAQLYEIGFHETAPTPSPQ